MLTPEIRPGMKPWKMKVYTPEAGWMAKEASQ